MSLFHPRSIAVAILFGCATGCTSGLVDPEIPTPGTPDFEEGYLDGCRSGYTDAGRDGYQNSYRKDTRRFAIDADYRQGWNQAHDACYEEEKRHPRVLGNGGHRHM